MIDNATFRANVENTACKVPTPEPGLHDLLVRLGELTKENQGISYQIRDNLFGPIPTNGTSCENAIGCAKDALEDAIERLAEANDILRYVGTRL